jgi:hypothetical protein
LVADYRRVVGPDDPETMMALGNLAEWQGEAGEGARAVATYTGLVVELARVLGPTHPETAAAVRRMMYWQQRAGSAGVKTS